PDQRNQNHQHDRLKQTLVEEADLLAHLPPLIRSHSDYQVRGQRPAHFVNACADRSSEAFDLVALTHFHRYRDGTPAAPTTRVPVRIESKKTRRVLVASAGDSQIAQI